MNSDNPILKIQLEDYGLPRYSSISRSYYGTKQDIHRLMFRLAANNWTRTRYAEMIEAVDSYNLDPDIVHNVAGSEYPILTPLNKIHSKNFSLHDLSWNCIGHSGAVYPARTESVQVEQVLLQQGTTIHRCARVTFYELTFCMQVFGWMSLGNEIKGFPGQVTYTPQYGHEMCLYMHLESYAQEERGHAMQDCGRLSQDDLSTLCVDLLGEV